jgi:hypothetical protein
MPLYLTYGQPCPDFSVLRGKTVQLAVPGTAPNAMDLSVLTWLGFSGAGADGRLF